MFEQIKKELIEYGAFKNQYSPITETIAEAVPTDIAYKMKLTIATSETILYASHLRRNILLWDDTEVPINGIFFVLASSGEGKDSSVNAARRCFQDGYKLIQAKREELAIKNAQELAKQAGVDEYYLQENYKEFYTTPEDLFAASSSTIKGLTLHFNQLEEAGIGGGYIYTGEIANEIANGNILELMQFMAEIYDIGKKEVKLIGTKDEQVKAINNLPVSALFVGSQTNILQDQNSKNAFKNEFTSRLARRSFFNFNNIKIPLKQYSSIEEMLQEQKQNNDKAKEIRKFINNGVASITKDNIDKIGTPLKVNEQVYTLFEMYKRYNKELAEQMSPIYPISIISRKHMQWKVLKLAGAFAIFNENNEIMPIDFIQALNFAELLADDLKEFENELMKEPYQLFADYMKSITENNVSTISFHLLRKLGFVSGSMKSIEKIKELCTLASSYDKNGIFIIKKNNVIYEQIIPESTLYISFYKGNHDKIYEAIKNNDSLALKKAKALAAIEATEETFKTLALTFKEIPDKILKYDGVYSPFQFKHGIHLKENIINTTKIVVFDIDHSFIEAKELHFILSDINHHIALSSDKNNQFKFRLIIELEAEVTLSAIEWKEFFLSIAKELAITVDPLPQSTLFFSYKDSPIYSVIDQNAIKVKQHILNAKNKEVIDPKTLSKTAKTKALKDPFITFNYAYEAKHTEGYRKLLAAALHARDLGGTQDEIINLMYDINDYWVDPMDKHYLEKHIISQIKKM